VSETRASACCTGCRSRALSEQQLAPQAVAGAGQRRIANGDEPALLPWRAAARLRRWRLLWGHEPGPRWPVPTPSLAVEKGNGQPPASRRPQPCSPQGPEASLLVNKRIERAASAALGLDVGPEGAPEQGAATWRSPRPRSQWRPAQGHLHLIGQWATGSARSAHSRRPPRPWPLSTV